VAAAEVAIGLAILTLLFRVKGTISVDVTNIQMTPQLTSQQLNYLPKSQH
jgi:hypothetical protein